MAFSSNLRALASKLSVWPPNASLYASSYFKTCVYMYLRLCLARTLGQPETPAIETIMFVKFACLFYFTDETNSWSWGVRLEIIFT